MRRLFDPGLAGLALALVMSRTWDVGYAILALETLWGLIVSVLIAALFSITTARSDLLRAAARGLLFTGLIVTYFVTSPLVMAALLFAGPLGMAVMHRHLQPHFFLVFAIVFVGAKLVRDQQELGSQQTVMVPSPHTNTQILVHLVLDEMGSFESVPEAFQDRSEIAELKRAYEKRGFRLHPGLPSISPETIESLGALVDRRRGTGNVTTLSDQNAHKVISNALHRRFLNKEWGVSIVQSSYLDFCSDKAMVCRTYRIGNNAHTLSDANLPFSKRLKIFERELLGSSRGAWQRATPTLALSALAQLDLITEHTKSLTGKQYVFGHLLLPHFPWTLNSDCTVKPTTEWRLPYAARANNEPGAQEAAMQAYWQQASCTHRRLLQMIDVLDAAHPGRVKFVIHGDHGPRILRRTLPTDAEDPVDEDVRRNVVEPFIATRLSPRVEALPVDQQTMQALVEQLLLAEAAVQSYSPAP